MIESINDILAHIENGVDHKCRCGTAIDWPGACDRCVEAHERWRAADLRRDAVASLPVRFRSITLDSPELAVVCGADAPLRARALADAMLSGSFRSAVMFGPSGAGKTMLGQAILRHVIAEDRAWGHSARYVHALALPEDRDVKRFVSFAWLLIDDAGQGARHENLRTLLGLRYDTGSTKTIVTTFLTREQMRERCGADVARRVWEHAGSITLGGKA